MNRRHFLGLAAAAGVNGPLRAWALETARILPPWSEGTLDIHHLAYGRGNSTFVMGPDGTTLLIDAGTTKDGTDVSCAQRPDASERPGQWIADYILRVMQPAGRRELDYALITHIHPDHLGDLSGDEPSSPKGNYKLTGLMDVDAKVPIRTLIDRGFPDYTYPTQQTAPYATNYLGYVQSRVKQGKRTERIQVGSASQIVLRQNRRGYPGFSVRNLAANGEVWTGKGDETRQTFPALSSLAKSDYPTENMCSIALRLSYGKFDYFTGGDLSSDMEETGEAWRDIETAAAHAAGPVEVAVADHHGYYDAVGVGFVKALRPRAFVIPAWYVGHPSIVPLRRMLSRALYPGDRDVYATCSMEANRLVNSQFLRQLKSLEGHVIVRVSPGGDEYRIFVTENAEDTGRIKLDSGPYRTS
ncbi:hypothetical protein GCM10011586_36360 [Silvibacterium dinghuense]|nr:hypothetical protein GCM10011586_36360 [Silvibacterium dinghuense]